MPVQRCQKNGRSGYKWGKSWVDYFWDGVDIKGKDECWEWLWGTDSNNRGMFRAPNTDAPYRAYRLAYALATYKNYHDLNCICHECDNPLCCNPNHLTEADQRYNVSGMMLRQRAKGQFKKGHIPANKGKTSLETFVVVNGKKRRTVEKTCIVCHQNYFVRSDHAKRKNANFCSRQCHAKSKKNASS